jgi:hypothetical protein
VAQAYTSQCRYWELNALAVRWFYLALLPALFPYPHPGQVRARPWSLFAAVFIDPDAHIFLLSQVFLAIGVTMIFLQVR